MDFFWFIGIATGVCLLGSALIAGALSWLLTGSRLGLVGGLAATFLVGTGSAVALGLWVGVLVQGEDPDSALFLWILAPALGVGASAGGAIGSLTRGSRLGRPIGRWWLAWLPLACALIVTATLACLLAFGLGYG